MILSFSNSDYLPFGKFGLNLNWDSSLAKSKIYFSPEKEEKVGDSTFVEVLSLKQQELCLVSQFTFGEGSKILGVSCSPETIISQFEDCLLEGSCIKPEVENELEYYSLGNGLRDFAYRGMKRFFYPNEEMSDESEILNVINGINDANSTSELLDALNVAVDFFDKILVVSGAYERCYLISTDMNKAAEWLSDICFKSGVSLGYSNPVEFPKSL